MIVLLACFTGKGCYETSTAYTHYNKNVMELFMEAETNAKKVAGPFVVDYVVPLMTSAVRRELTVKLNRSIQIKVNETQTALVFAGEF